MSAVHEVVIVLEVTVDQEVRSRVLAEDLAHALHDVDAVYVRELFVRGIDYAPELGPVERGFPPRGRSL